MRNYAVVGSGRWGKNHVKTYNHLDALGAIVEVDSNVRQKIKSEYPDIEVYSDIGDLLANDQIKGVSVATPAETHFAITKSLLEGGKDVLVEKPITLFSREAEELTALAASKNRILMVGHVMLYHPAIKKIKEMIDDGIIGKVQYIGVPPII